MSYGAQLPIIILQFLYLSKVTHAGMPEIIRFCGAWTVAIGLALSHNVLELGIDHN
jgi:hypothetical protein